MHNDKVDKLETEVRLELKNIYKSITYIKEKMVDVKVNLNFLIDGVKKLNDYSHERVHYLLNTDKGVELKLKDLSSKVDKLESFEKTTTAIRSKIIAKILDFGFKLLIGIFLLILGHLMKWPVI